ncbi:MAG: cobyrinate a,c-diamide synthase [Nitrospirae bacterium]|nr:cobyrinate a,c-diamide synthase [Nitrospirota bacterium]MCL5285097.1 cobyrinate a,c-diamide synthase [Nitrospirota bacterium]
MTARGVVVAGAGSGSGKTLVTMALLWGLAQRGFSVHPFKCGPDFIDPRHHEWIARIPSGNLDLHFSEPSGLRERFDRQVAGSSGGVVEGVMGLFDGLARGSSTWDIARALELPVILVLSAQGMAETLAALVRGIVLHREGPHFLGVIATRTGSDRHRKLIADALAAEGLPPLLGVLPRDEALSLPERHLGLCAPGEQGTEEAVRLRQALSCAADALDWSRILSAFSPPSVPAPEFRESGEECTDFTRAWRTRNTTPFHSSSRVRRFLRLGVVLDEAFWFYYPENWELFEKCGIDIVFFSLLKDRRLPPNCDGLYLGGGYPERFFRELALNRKMIGEVRQFCASGRPVYAECGGLLYLTEGPLQEEAGEESRLAGIFPLRYSMGDRLKRLGYAEVTAGKGFFSEAPGSVRGHLFHYSRLSGGGTDLQGAFLHTSDGTSEGFAMNGVVASYLHLFFPSNPLWGEALARALEKGRND